MSSLEKAEMLIRKSLSEEEKAISDYLVRKQQLLDLQDVENDEELILAFQTYIKVLEDIISEEQIHVGQLRQLLTVFNIPLNNEETGKEETVETLVDVNTVSKEMFRV